MYLTLPAILSPPLFTTDIYVYTYVCTSPIMYTCFLPFRGCPFSVDLELQLQVGAHVFPGALAVRADR